MSDSRLQTPGPPPIDRPRIGLALSGGAARGIAHVGVLRALAEHDIPIDCVAGTSAGSVVGGALAAGLTLAEIEKLATSTRWRDVGRLAFSLRGLQSNERMAEYLRARLPVTRFEELQLPFAAVATDLDSGEAVIMRDEGDVPFAIRASCAIPGWYVPVTDDQGRRLVDGGLVSIIPSTAARALGADLVIAVDVNAEGAKFMGRPKSVFGFVLQAIMVVQRTVSLRERMEADVVISPRVGHIRWDQMGRAKELLECGYQAGSENIEAIKRLLSAGTESPKELRQRREA